MRVFISWSGELSRQLAQEICDWLPSAIQFVKPYFAPNDIEKGARWEAMLTGELSETAIGLFVITRDNVASKWLHFEAGAIAKTVNNKSRVCPILFGLEPTDLEGPLTHFPGTKFTKDDVQQLFMSINAAGGDAKLSEVSVGKVFEKWWPDLETSLTAILNAYAPTAPTTEVRTQRELIEEILERVRKLPTGTGVPRSFLRPATWVNTRMGELLLESDAGTNAASPTHEIFALEIKSKDQERDLERLLEGLQASGEGYRIVRDPIDVSKYTLLVPRQGFQTLSREREREHGDEGLP